MLAKLRKNGTSLALLGIVLLAASLRFYGLERYDRKLWIEDFLKSVVYLPSE